MSSNTDILAILSTEADEAVDQIILDSKRLHIVVNGTGTEQAITEDGSLIPSVRKALIDNLYFKTPPIPWRTGTTVNEYNQLYVYTDSSANTTWWYAPGATVSAPVVMQSSPVNDPRFKVFMDKTTMADIYAPIVSPDFKGNPRVPTPATADNSTTIPNTLWVQAKVEELRGEIHQSQEGIFENITVSNDSVLKNLYTSGAVVFSGPTLSAPGAVFTTKKIILSGADAELAFEANAAPPVGAITKTNLKPYEIVTGNLQGDNFKATNSVLGDVAKVGVATLIDGNVEADYLHLTGNNRNPSTRAQLLVDGIAEVKTLRVIDGIEGIDLTVDGKNILPNSVTTTAALTVGTNAKVNGDLRVDGTSTLKNLNVTGSVTGIAFTVDGKDIHPNSVSVLTDQTVGGDLTVTGETTIRGKTTVKDLTVEGVLSAALDLSGTDISVDNINVVEKATVHDLIVTGTTTGITADVNGKDITPSSVWTTGNIGVGGDLQVAGTFKPNAVEATTITTGSLVASQNGSVAGKLTVNNLEVTGTTTGIVIDANIDGKAVAPKSVRTETLTTTGNSSLAGTTTVENLAITGTVTGLDLNIPEENLIVKSITAAQPSTFTTINSGIINNTGKITTHDIQVMGDILGADGLPIGEANVDGKDISPKSVTTPSLIATSARVDGSATVKGTLTVQTELDVQGPIKAPSGKSIVNDLQVNGSLTDSLGNAIGTAESIEGKDIKPRTVVAQIGVSGATLTATGATTTDSLIVSNQGTIKNLSVGEVATVADLRIGTAFTAPTIEVNNILVKRVAGQTGNQLTVEGSTLLSGNLEVTGTFRGDVDLSAQDIIVKTLQVTGNTSLANVTASLAVTGQSVVGGSAQDPEFIGIKSLSSADIGNDLNVGGDVTIAGALKVTGAITGNVDLTGQTIAPAVVNATTKITTKDLTVTGTLAIPDVPTTIANLTVTNLTGAAVSASKYSVAPKSVVTSSASYVPDGTTSVYNVDVQTDVAIEAPTGMLTGGKAESFFMFLQQDSVGHAVTFSNAFVVHGGKVVNPAANALTICNMVYRGIGNLIDVFITERS